MKLRIYSIAIIIFVFLDVVNSQELIYNSAKVGFSGALFGKNHVTEYSSLSEISNEYQEILVKHLKNRTQEHYKNLKFVQAIGIDIKSLHSQFPNIKYEVGQFAKIVAIYEWKDKKLGIGSYYLSVAIDSFGQLISMSFPNLSLHRNINNEYKRVKLIPLDKAVTVAKKYISNKVKIGSTLSYQLQYDHAEESLYWSIFFNPQNETKSKSQYYECKVDIVNWYCLGYYYGESMIPSTIIEIEEEIIELKK